MFRSNRNSGPSEEEQRRTQQMAARVLIQDNRKKLLPMADKYQKIRQFYWWGVGYTASTMIGFSVLMMGVRQVFPLAGKVPVLLYTAGGYFMGGEVWKVHQRYEGNKCAALIDDLQREMETLDKKFPHLAEYRGEIKALERIRADLQLQRKEEVASASSASSTSSLSLWDQAMNVVKGTATGGHTAGAGGDKVKSDPMDDLVSEILLRSKAKNKLS
eukprot:PhF_6_TR9448/c0_g1_i1/m.14763